MAVGVSQGPQAKPGTPSLDPVSSFRTPTAFLRPDDQLKEPILKQGFPVEFSFPPSLKRTPRGTQ